VAEQFLHGPNVVAGSEEVRDKRGKNGVSSFLGQSALKK